jgi:hypothetical protein
MSRVKRMREDSGFHGRLDGAPIVGSKTTSPREGRQAADSAMSFRVLRNNPLNRLHFLPNFLQMALVC